MSLYQLPRPETRHTVADLIRQLFSEWTELIQQHIELTKTEVREEGRLMAKAAVFGIIGLVFAQVMLLFLGNLLMIILMMNRVSILAATVITMGVFLVLTGITVGFCLMQLKQAQKLLKPGQ